MNQVIVVGRLVSDPKIIETENKKKTRVTIRVPRSYKDLNGVYKSDVVDCVLWSEMAQQVCELCKKGDLLAVKGRIQSSVTIDDGTTYDETVKNELTIVAEKVTFLANGRKNSNE